MASHTDILNHKELLNILAYSKPKYKKAILKAVDKKLILIICDIIYNLLEGHIILSETDKTFLRKHKKFLRNFIEKSSFKHKKKILEQKGSGILSVLIPAALSTLTSLISNLQ